MSRTPEMPDMLEIFEQVFDLPPKERAEALLRLTDDDETLRARVESLLNAAELADETDFLSEDTIASMFVLSDADVTERALPTVPGYELVGVLGSGSSGIVYKARAPEPLKRTVAIKVLHGGLPLSAMRRFRREQRLLAALNHPGIAQVYDEGQTTDGRDFVAVEYVEGNPLNTYCKLVALTWRKRVQLMVDVCHAVQYLHANGVLHRDLKPANVLVAELDGIPQAKVIDFGSAVDVGSSMALRTTGPRIVGTLAYMAPEQLDPKSLVDARADVYAIGLMLHEVLLGRHPFGAGDADLMAYLDRIRTVELPALPRELGPDRSELQAVARKATSRTPSKRYASAQHLADDLDRVLRKLPIEARPPSIGNRALRVIRRHPRLAGLSALAAVSIVSLAVWGFANATEAQRDRDRLNDTVAQLVDGVLEELGELDGALAVRSSLAALLDERVQEIPAVTFDQALQQLRIREAMGDVAAAREELAEAESIRQEIVVRAHALLARFPDRMDAFDAKNTAIVKLGNVHESQGHVEKAREAYLSVHDALLKKANELPGNPSLLDDLSWSHERLLPYERLHDLPRAYERAYERLAIAEEFHAQHPSPNSAYGLGCAYAWVAALTRDTQGAVAALEASQESLEYLETALEEVPFRFWYRSRYVSSVRTHAAYLIEAKRGPSAQHAAHAVATAREFVADNPGHPHSDYLLRRALEQMAGELSRRGLEDEANMYRDQLSKHE